jgi:hypothetical protein
MIDDLDIDELLNLLKEQIEAWCYLNSTSTNDNWMPQAVVEELAKRVK